MLNSPLNYVVKHIFMKYFVSLYCGFREIRVLGLKDLGYHLIL
ncbi:MAG: hypothetical protein H6Q14_3009 [Bacteroidetes bacterium]|nr:hypothetical protein [Bacteroidota bacterium]